MRPARTALVAGVVAVAAAGCGGSHERDRVRAYFKAVDKVQRSEAAHVAEINDAYEKFTLGKLKGDEARLELLRAEIRIDNARKRLAALRPPSRARRLHELLLENYRRNVALATETHQLASYVPRAQALLGDLGSARKRLRRELAPSRGVGLQRSALRRYARSLGRIVRRLGRLRAPPALAGARETQLRVLGHARTLTRQLVAAIDRQDQAAVTSLLGRFRAGGDPQPGRAVYDRGAVAAYGQRVGELKRLDARIRSEQARVSRGLR